MRNTKSNSKEKFGMRPRERRSGERKRAEAKEGKKGFDK